MDSPLIDLVYLVLAGCFGGYISGLLGVGGGIIFVPILDYFLTKSGANSHDLVSCILANSFFAIFVSGIKGSLPAFVNNSIHKRTIGIVGFSAIVGGLVSTLAINLGTWYSPLIFKCIFSGLLLLTLAKTMFHVQSTEGAMSDNLSIRIGVLTGIVAGLSGLGGGIIMVPLFMMFGHMPIKQASTLSLAIIPILVLPNIVYYLFKQPLSGLDGSTGFIVWPIVIPMVVGVILTVKMGVLTANKVSAKTIKSIFAGFIILTIVRILTTL